MHYGKRDTRYVLTRRYSKYSRTPSCFFQRTDPDGFQLLDEHARQVDRPQPRLFGWKVIAFLVLALVLEVVVLSGIIIYVRRPEPASYQTARDETARQRATAFVQALGFAPGPAVCRAKRDGSAWCTIRVAGSDKTFRAVVQRRASHVY
jgi:hypothetical protein